MRAVKEISFPDTHAHGVASASSFLSIDSKYAICVSIGRSVPAAATRKEYLLNMPYVVNGVRDDRVICLAASETL